MKTFLNKLKALFKQPDVKYQNFKVSSKGIYNFGGKILTLDSSRPYIIEISINHLNELDYTVTYM